jgi:hypothetical protein
VTPRLLSIAVAATALAGTAGAAPRRAPSTCRVGNVDATRLAPATAKAPATLTSCYDSGGKRSCWSLDLDAATWTARPATALPPLGRCGALSCGTAPTRGDAVLTVATKVSVCGSDGTACAALLLPSIPADPDAVVASADRRLVAVGTDDGLTILDTTTGKRLASLPTWTPVDTGLGWRFLNLRFYGDLLLIGRTDGVHTVARLVDARTGATRAELADLDPAPPVVVAGALVFATTDGETLRFHDLVTGKLTRNVPLFAHTRGGRASLPVFAAAVDDHRLVALRTGGDGAVAIVDLATAQVQLVEPPAACPRKRSRAEILGEP